jgi:hypothetical protein
MMYSTVAKAFALYTNTETLDCSKGHGSIQTWQQELPANSNCKTARSKKIPRNVAIEGKRHNFQRNIDKEAESKNEVAKQTGSATTAKSKTMQTNTGQQNESPKGLM